MREIKVYTADTKMEKDGVAAKNNVLAQRDEIAHLCRKYAVRKLQLFGGSAVRSDFDSGLSDLDFLVNFSNDDEPGIADRYLGLAEDLESLLSRSVRNPYFRQSVEKSALTLYEA